MTHPPIPTGPPGGESPSWHHTLRSLLQEGLHDVEQEFDEAARSLRRRLGRRDAVVIQPYRGVADRHELWLTGRVLEDEGIPEASEADSTWRNLLAMVMRFESDELAGVRVEAKAAGTTTTATTDEEGYFEVRLPAAAGRTAAVSWRSLDLRLREEAPSLRSVRATGRVLMPGSAATYGVISDIDDTILPSGATSLLRLARSTLLHNVRTRLPFDGVSTFYRALAEGCDEARRHVNPVFYVSSSPWNLYDFLEEFLTIHRLPSGPLFLRDLGLDDEQFIAGGHDHKLARIERIFACCPDLPFILVGDSGQADPEIYDALLRTHPDRIRAVYIRHVADDARREEITALTRQAARADAAMLLVADTAEAAEHAAGAGWIHPDRLDDVRASCERTR